jgi:putative AlgH/UPF0301 family transcriptional regulator
MERFLAKNLIKPVDVSILRSLRTAAKIFDDQPAYRGLLVSPPTPLKIFAGNGTYFLPKKAPHTVGTSAVELQSLAAIITEENSVRGFVTRFFRSTLRLQRHADMEAACFHLIKYLNSVISIIPKVPLNNKGEPGTIFKSARSQWSDLKPGMLLVSHPVIDEDWNRTVVLVTKHDVLKGGTVGYILNRPALGAAREVRSLLRPAAGKSRKPDPSEIKPQVYKGTATNQKVLDRLVWNQLQTRGQSGHSFGGPLPSAEILHATKNVATSALESTGLFLGVKTNADVDGKEDSIFPNPSKKFLGCSGWSPGHISFQIKENFWIPVVIEDPVELTEIAFSTDGHKIWSRLMMSLGEDYAELARLPQNTVEHIESILEEDDDLDLSDDEDWEDHLNS